MQTMSNFWPNSCSPSQVDQNHDHGDEQSNHRRHRHSGNDSDLSTSRRLLSRNQRLFRFDGWSGCIGSGLRCRWRRPLNTGGLKNWSRKVGPPGLSQTSNLQCVLGARFQSGDGQFVFDRLQHVNVCRTQLLLSGRIDQRVVGLFIVTNLTTRYIGARVGQLPSQGDLIGTDRHDTRIQRSSHTRTGNQWRTRCSTWTERGKKFFGIKSNWLNKLRKTSFLSKSVLIDKKKVPEKDGVKANKQTFGKQNIKFWLSSRKWAERINTGREDNRAQSNPIKRQRHKRPINKDLQLANNSARAAAKS